MINVGVSRKPNIYAAATALIDYQYVIAIQMPVIELITLGASIIYVTIRNVCGLFSLCFSDTNESWRTDVAGNNVCWVDFFFYCF
jgi:hypothetical protein